jgi:hypothetical protein
MIFCVARLIDGVAHFNLANDDKDESLANLRAFYSEYLSPTIQSFAHQYKLRVVSNEEFMTWQCQSDKYIIKPERL